MAERKRSIPQEYNSIENLGLLKKNRKENPQQKPEQEVEPELPEVKWIDLVRKSPSRIAIPIGPKYQADVQNWIENQNKQDEEEKEYLLGEKIWPIHDFVQEACNGTTRIGKGRCEIFSC